MLKTVTITVKCESDEFLINVYGDANRYQPTPMVGQKVNEKGVIAAFRKRSVTKHHSEDDLYADNLSDRVIYTDPGALVKFIDALTNLTCLMFILEVPDTTVD